MHLSGKPGMYCVNSIRTVYPKDLYGPLDHPEQISLISILN